MFKLSDVTISVGSHRVTKDQDKVWVDMLHRPTGIVVKRTWINYHDQVTERQLMLEELKEKVRIASLKE